MGLRGPVKDFTVITDIKLWTVALRWSYPLKAETWYLYRNKKAEPMQFYQTLEDNITEWKETAYWWGLFTSTK
jgi:hypothetical protein